MVNSSVEMAISHVFENLGANPRDGILRYYTMWHERTTDAADEFVARSKKATRIATETTQENINDSNAVERAGVEGALLAVMVSCAVRPNYSLHAASIRQTYRALSDRIIEQRGSQLPQLSAGVLGYAKEYELTLPVKVRMRLQHICKQLQPKYDEITYTLALFSLYAISELMGIPRDLHTIIDGATEDEFDTVLEAIVNGTWVQ